MGLEEGWSIHKEQIGCKSSFIGDVVGSIIPIDNKTAVSL